MTSHRHPLFALLAHLDLHHIPYSLARTRADSVGIFVTLSGRRIEIFVFDDGHLEYSIFAGTEDVLSDEDDLPRELALPFESAQVTASTLKRGRFARAADDD